MGARRRHDPADYDARRQSMIENQIRQRGITTPTVLTAMERIRREQFVPYEVREFAYEDTALMVAAGQIIPQPYVIALIVDALELSGNERVLDVGTGSGYLAAVLGCIAKEVYSIEQNPLLADQARRAVAAQNLNNVLIRNGDSDPGWPEQSPFDAIVVSAGGARVSEPLIQQLKVGGSLIMPLGDDPRVRELVRVKRVSENKFVTIDLADVSFIPPIGNAGWQPESPHRKTAIGRLVTSDTDLCLAQGIAKAAITFDSVENMPLSGLLDRIGDARLVLIGEASHGTAEFYQARARITQELIKQKGFSFVAIEGDWPDAARVDHYVRHAEYPPSEWTAFARFPTWMWRNEEVRSFVDWLRDFNSGRSPETRIAFHGLDLYSLFNSIRAILDYLDKVDPTTAAIARQRYGCLTPYQADPSVYARAALGAGYESCERPVLEMLRDLHSKHRRYAEHDGEQFLNLVQNARLVADAEEYYRTMFYGSRSAWNLRDTHMFETLEALLEHHGSNSRGIVWAHNSHVGDSDATDMARRGEFNIGRLCRARFGSSVYSIGFGTHTGTVAAASDWDAPMQIKQVLPSLQGSYERLCHESGKPRFLLPLRGSDKVLSIGLRRRHIERAIGVIYRPETERQSHYFYASLPGQFDEYIWFDETRAVTPLETRELEGLPDTYPFGL